MHRNYRSQTHPDSCFQLHLVLQLVGARCIPAKGLSVVHGIYVVQRDEAPSDAETLRREHVSRPGARIPGEASDPPAVVRCSRRSAFMSKRLFISLLVLTSML